ncbi:MAG: hypothetical protein DRJ34_01535 [Thermoprotei archaeon]|nr:MAG: hypothetical protein DRJ34_01535 [Thermoprotei archaeon]
MTEYEAPNSPHHAGTVVVVGELPRRCEKIGGGLPWWADCSRVRIPATPPRLGEMKYGMRR